MTAAPKRLKQVPCKTYAVNNIWLAHIERQRRRETPGSWSEPLASTVPCQHCGWSKYIHTIAKEVDLRIAKKKVEDRATRKKKAT
jgi:hypothetical protein